MKFIEFQKKMLDGSLKKRDDLKLSDTDTSLYFEDTNHQIISFLPSANHLQLFKTEQKFKQLVAAIKSQLKGKRHILEPYQERINGIEEHIIEEIVTISDLLKINISKLDFSKQSLQNITSCMRQMRISSIFFFDELFFSVGIYLGEVIRINHHGKWVKQKKTSCIELDIELFNRNINLFPYLWEQANEHYKSFSLLNIYENLITDFRL